MLNDLSNNFAEGTEYFQILVKIFQDVLKNDEQKHLQNFFAIIPAMTLNFVEKNMQHKEKLNKQSGRFEASFTDDGFALGLAYIMRVLDQDASFDSLHWFEAVNVYINNKRAESQFVVQPQAQQQGPRGGSSKEAKEAAKQKAAEDALAAQVVMKKLNAIQMEFELIYYSFSGARIFFQEVKSGPGAGVEGTEKQDEKKDAAGAATGGNEQKEGENANGIPNAPSMIPTAPPLEGGMEVNGVLISAAAPPPPPPPSFLIPMAPPM